MKNEKMLHITCPKRVLGICPQSVIFCYQQFELSLLSVLRFINQMRLNQILWHSTGCFIWLQHKNGALLTLCWTQSSQILMKVVRTQMALEDIKTLAQMLEKSIRFGYSFNHQMAPCNSIFLDLLHNFKNQNFKICTFLASNGQNLMASDENN